MSEVQPIYHIIKKPVSLTANALQVVDSRNRKVAAVITDPVMANRICRLLNADEMEIANAANPINWPIATDPGLLELLKSAAEHDMTPQEIEMQRRLALV